jgi:hypothetical protein
MSGPGPVGVNQSGHPPRHDGRDGSHATGNRSTHCSASPPGRPSLWAGCDRRRGGRSPSPRFARHGRPAPAGSAGGLAAVEAPATGSILGGGRGGILGVGLEPDARDPGRPLLEAARARTAVGTSDAGRHGSRGHGSCATHATSQRSTCPAPRYRGSRKQTAAIGARAFGLWDVDGNSLYFLRWL